MLPEVKKVVLQDLNFPTAWQTVIFRNFSFVPTDKIADVLKTKPSVVEREAERLGLSFEKEFLAFEEKGYLTIIRNNWYLLPYEQLLVLLGTTEKNLDDILRDEDFFGIKLGGVKPQVPKVLYSPLTEKQLKETEKIAEVIRNNLKTDKAKPFDFFSGERLENYKPRKNENQAIIHGYLTPCKNAFSLDGKDGLSDSLLASYAEKGINGVWVHGTLRDLAYFPFNPKLSEGYENNREILKNAIKRAAKYGIKVYLYLNEPRTLPLAEFIGKENLKGTEKNGEACLCVSTKEVQDYLYNAVFNLAVYLENLGGIFNITMSENLTHCKSHVWTKCPRCKDVPAAELCARVINIMAKALRDSGTGAEMIANLWGWSPHLEMSEEEALRGISLLDKDVSVLETSEYWLALNKGGIKSNLIDYSISNVGPSELTEKKLAYAQKLGHKVYAKVQVNNSWECAAVPYLPVFDLVAEHLGKLRRIGVKNLLLSWTLGGYPSKNLDLVADFFADKEFSLDKFYSKNFKNPELVKRAVGVFCRSFSEFPFSVSVVYNSPHTLGPANLWSLEADEKKSTMTCFSFDDYREYISPYTYAVYMRQMRKTIDGFNKAVKILQEDPRSDTAEITRYIKTAYVMYKSDYLHTRFARYKGNAKQNKKILINCLVGIKRLAHDLIELTAQDSRVGFETANGYFFIERNLLEKIVNADRLIRALSGGSKE